MKGQISKTRPNSLSSVTGLSGQCSLAAKHAAVLPSQGAERHLRQVREKGEADNEVPQAV